MFGLISLYEAQNVMIENNKYFGKIIIDKINLEYTIFNQFSEELLKISPCKFYGVNLGQRGNICITAHNYNDNRFFGRLNELEIEDKIILQDINGKSYEYTVFDIFETHKNDKSVLKSNRRYDLTLVTCNNSNQKRIIIKAYIKEY